MKKQWFQNSKRIIQDGKRILCDECPCGCPAFEGRPVICVDKYATGTGDGSSWENAYTKIQTAVNAHPKAEIQIKGYGEVDKYNELVILLECAYIKGIGSTWVNGVRAGYAAYFPSLIRYKTRAEAINTCGTLSEGFQFVDEVINCRAEGHSGGTSYGFDRCGYLENCTALNFFIGFSGGYYLESCTSLNCFTGFADNLHSDTDRNPVLINCISTGTGDDGWGWGGFGFADDEIESVTMTNCIARVHDYSSSRYTGFDAYNGTLTNCYAECLDDAEGFNGFDSGNSILSGCTAVAFGRCGFTGDGTSLYDGCTSTDNCQMWGGNCTGHDCEGPDA